MATGNVKAKIVSDNDIAFLRERVADLLCDKGMIVDHPEVLSHLRKAGAVVDDATCLVKFPKKLQEEALKQVPKEMILAGIEPKHDLLFPHPEGLFHTRAITGAMEEYTLEGTFEKITLERFASWIRLIDHLENVDFYSLLTISPDECPEKVQDIYALRTALLNTTKHGWVQPIEAKNNRWFIEMAAARVGGLEQLQKKPCISMISCCTSPFYLKNMDAEAIYQGAINNIPIQCCTLPILACTSPITPQGTTLQGVAEVIGMIIIAQCIRPGVPVIAANEPFATEMQNYYAIGCSIELAMCRMLSTQLLKDGYGLFCHTTCGGTDANTLNAQSALDQWLTKNQVVLAGGDIIGDLGYVEGSLSMSKLQLMLEDECCGMLKKLKAGLVVDDEAIAFQEIMQIEHHLGNFVSSKHSFKHFKEVYRPKNDLFIRESRDKWSEKGKKDLYDRAREVYESKIKNVEPVAVPESVKKDMDDVLAAATKDILG